MAKYKEVKVAQLELAEIPAHMQLDRYKYRLTVKSPETPKGFDSGKRSFDKNKRTIQVEIAHDTAVVIVDIYSMRPDSSLIYDQSYTLRHQDKKNAKPDRVKFKSKIAQNSTKENNVIKLDVESSSEVGWLLVKKEQTFDSLLKWVYQKTPTPTQLNIFRHLNAHISDLQDLNLNKVVKPGQIILLSRKQNSPQITEYKKLAREAEKNLQILSKDKNFDPVFFANNFELLMDFYNLSSQVARAKLEYMKTVEGHKEEYCKPLTINVPYEATSATATYSEKSKELFDEAKTKRLETKLVNELKENLAKIQESHAKEVSNRTKLANDKHYDKFRKANYQYYQKIEALLGKDLVTLKNNKDYSKILKDVVKDSSGVRAANFQGGLKLAVGRMQAIGSATLSLKYGANIIFYLSAIESAGKVYSASQTGDAGYTLRVTAVETATLGGGLAGGSVGTAVGAQIGGSIGLVLSPFTAGLSYPVLTVSGAVIGAVGGGIAGTFFFNEQSKKRLGVC